MFAKTFASLLLVAALLGAVPRSAFCLPWDADMTKQQSYKANELTRSPVPGTVPLGYQPFTMTVDEAAAQLKNPEPFTLDSVWRGRRSWTSNCSPCHGKLGDSNTFIGPTMKAPSLLSDDYKNRPDGRAFFAIKNGLGNMPRYGFKFSTQEQWDVVNYLRFLQGRQLEGMPRPQ